MIDEHLETVRSTPGNPDSSGPPRTGLSLLVIGVAYLAWFALGAVLGPVWIALLQRSREMADGAWASGDDL